ncbi:MAG: hypothetical protein ACKVOH_03165 [Chlamydiales bacterium]
MTPVNNHGIPKHIALAVQAVAQVGAAKAAVQPEPAKIDKTLFRAMQTAIAHMALDSWKIFGESVRYNARRSADIEKRVALDYARIKANLLVGTRMSEHHHRSLVCPV